MKLWLIFVLVCALFISSSATHPTINFHEQLVNLQRSFPKQVFPVERARRLFYTMPQQQRFEEEEGRWP